MTHQNKDLSPVSHTAPTGAGADKTTTRWAKPSDARLRETLDPLAYQVTQQDGTEPPFRNKYWDNHAQGLYVDRTTGEPLFSSADKFESGTGWPSFVRPIEGGRVTTRTDMSHGRVRTEVRSNVGDAHLGHVFPDGPKDRGGLRYCMNSAAMRFIPLEQLEEEGYGEYRDLVLNGAQVGVKNAPTFNADAQSEAATSCEASVERAVLAGGCFWGMQDILRKVPGVLATEVGYTGGTTENPTYAQVSRGNTGHAESIEIIFDPEVISYEELLEKYFFRMHDPTTMNRQGNDRGTQYRSAIFTTSPEQAETARRVMARVQESGLWKNPIVTEVTPAGAWTAAEEGHQDYLEKNPGGYTCHWMR